MILFKTKSYKRAVKSLGKDIAKILVAQEKLISEDIFHPKLHTKKLKG